MQAKAPNFNPNQTGWYSITNIDRMEGWVDFGVGYMIYLCTDSHPSK